MNRSLMIMAGFLILAGTGCAPIPYQGPYCAEPQIIVIYEPVPYPVPYPVPGEVGGSDPLPERRSPLTKQPSTGNPRIKTPRGDRSEDPPVVARGGDGRTKKKSAPRRRK